jgi:hypothetical protein
VIERIARNTALACVVIAVLFAIWKRSIVASLAVVGGGLLIGISFWAIASAVDQLILRSQGETGRKTAGFSLVKFFTRYAIVALAAYGMMVRLRVDPMGLLLGVSSFGVAVAVEVLRDLRWRRFP